MFPRTLPDPRQIRAHSSVAKIVEWGDLRLRQSDQHPVYTEEGTGGYWQGSQYMPQATADGARHSAFLGKITRPGPPLGAAQQTLPGGFPPQPRAPSELGEPRPYSRGPEGRPDSQGPVHGRRRTRVRPGGVPGCILCTPGL